MFSKQQHIVCIINSMFKLKAAQLYLLFEIYLCSGNLKNISHKGLLMSNTLKYFPTKIWWSYKSLYFVLKKKKKKSRFSLPWKITECSVYMFWLSVLFPLELFSFSDNISAPFIGSSVWMLQLPWKALFCPQWQIAHPLKILKPC